jgi:hypothetical protein
MAHSKDRPSPVQDDITDPREILLFELAAARRELQELVARMKRERLEWQAHLNALQRSPRLTASQKANLRRRRP